jgi:hypothetical protein
MVLRTERCEEGGHDVPAHDAVHLTVSPKQSRRICTRCFNALIAEQAGVRFEHPDFVPIGLEDAAGTPYELHFRTRHGGDHVAVESFETVDDEVGGYQFHVLGDPSDDPITIFQQLFEPMRRALARTHIEKSPYGPRIAKSAESYSTSLSACQSDHISRSRPGSGDPIPGGGTAS